FLIEHLLRRRQQFLLPVVEHRRVDPFLSAQVGNFHAGLHARQHDPQLLVGRPLSSLAHVFSSRGFLISLYPEEKVGYFSWCAIWRETLHAWTPCVNDRRGRSQENAR